MTRLGSLPPSTEPTLPQFTAGLWPCEYCDRGTVDCYPRPDGVACDACNGGSERCQAPPRCSSTAEWEADDGTRVCDDHRTEMIALAEHEADDADRCQGCDDAHGAPTRPYLAAFDGGGAEIVWYDEGCAELAHANWSGTVDWITGPLDPAVHCLGCSVVLAEPVGLENCSSLTHPQTGNPARALQKPAPPSPADAEAYFAAVKRNAERMRLLSEAGRADAL